MAPDASRRWYVVRTQVRAETKAAAHLRHQGFDVYCPQYRKRCRHARKVTVITAPLFPRYMFVGFNIAADRWRAVNSTVGVASLICTGEAPTPINEEVIRVLRDREDNDGFVVLQNRSPFSQGDRIKVRSGIFSDRLGLFEGMSDLERVTVLIDLLGRKVRVVLDSELVEAA